MGSVLMEIDSRNDPWPLTPEAIRTQKQMPKLFRLPGNFVNATLQNKHDVVNRSSEGCWLNVEGGSLHAYVVVQRWVDVLEISRSVDYGPILEYRMGKRCRCWNNGLKTDSEELVRNVTRSNEGVVDRSARDAFESTTGDGEATFEGGEVAERRVHADEERCGRQIPRPWCPIRRHYSLQCGLDRERERGSGVRMREGLAIVSLYPRLPQRAERNNMLTNLSTAPLLPSSAATSAMADLDGEPNRELTHEFCVDYCDKISPEVNGSDGRTARWSVG